MSNEEWTTSSYCGESACVEVRFRKSSFSNGESACVEVGREDGLVLVRNSNHLELGTWNFYPTTWNNYIETIKQDVPGLSTDDLGLDFMRELNHDLSMQFTEEEIVAFVKGVRAGEFDPEEMK